MTGQEQLAADVLNGYTPIGEVPALFADAVTDHIARRPSPKPPDVDPLEAVNRKLDEILTLLRGTP